MDSQLEARLEISNLKGLSISLEKTLSCKMQGTLETGVFAAIANDLISIFRGKDLQAVIKCNEAETEETGLETEGKGNKENQLVLNIVGFKRPGYFENIILNVFR